MRVQAPNYTQAPNDLFDHWLPHLGEAELKVLLVVMRKTIGWHKVRDEISASQLARITGMMEETVLKAAKSLQKRGIISRELVGEIGKQRVVYSLIIHENSNILYPPCLTPPPPLNPTPPVKPNPPDQNPPDKTPPTKETSYTKETTTTKPAAPAAVFSDKKKEATVKLYPILEQVDIPIHDKEEITRDYSEPDVIHGVTYALQPGRVIKTCLAAVIKWACKVKPELSQSKEDIETSNKAYAKRYDNHKSGSAYVAACNKYVEIVATTSVPENVIGYHEPGFIEKFKARLIKYGFKLLEEA